MAGRQSRWKRLSRLNCKDRNAKNRAKADRERFRRGKLGVFSRSDKLYRDARKMKRDICVFSCIFERTANGQGKYFAYKSHSSFWPTRDDLEENFPLTEYYTPDDFEKEEEAFEGNAQPEKPAPKPQRKFTISPPPSFNRPARVNYMLPSTTDVTGLGIQA